MASSEINTAAALLRGILDRSQRRAAGAPAVPAPAPAEAATRAERLERILAGLCALPGMQGALVADAGGLTVASWGGPFPADRLAAFSTLLGSALDGAGRLLGSLEADRASLRLSDEDEALLARFEVGGRPYQLVALCAVRWAGRIDLKAAVAALQAALSAPAGEAP